MPAIGVACKLHPQKYTICENLDLPQYICGVYSLCTIFRKPRNRHSP
jgi:hypothetical protein